jgi:hypothetical protein
VHAQWVASGEGQAAEGQRGEGEGEFFHGLLPFLVNQ